jgi:hypothetical protein
LQQALIDGAEEDSSGIKDAFGRPKRLWNAVEGIVFVGVSNGEQDGSYNCYPEYPPGGKLFREMQRRKERTRNDVLRGVGGD